MTPVTRHDEAGSRRLFTLAAAATASVVLTAAVALGAGGCGLNRQGALTNPATGGGSTTTTSTDGGTGGHGVGGFTLTGGGGAGATGAGGVGATGAGGGTGSENCLNGVDDDDDGLPDCADPDCQGPFSCVPMGYTTGTYVTVPAPTCPSGLTDATYYDCADCACTPAGGNCLMTVTLSETGATCTGSPRSFEHDGGDPCNDIQDFSDHSNDGVGAKAVNQPDGTESCAPESATSAAHEYPLCATSAAGGGCAPDNVCLPTSLRPWCVVVPSTAACPAGTIDQPSNVYPAAGTGQCDCDCDATASCPTTQQAVVYTDDGCMAVTAATVTADGACVDTTFSSIHAIMFQPLAADVQCIDQSTLPGAEPSRLCCPPS